MPQNQIIEWKKQAQMVIGNMNKQFTTFKMDLKQELYVIKFMGKLKINKVPLELKKQILKIHYQNYY